MQFKIGQHVMWRGGWGEQPPARAVIAGYGQHKGRRVYDLDNGHWAYAEQLQPATDRAA